MSNIANIPETDHFLSPFSPTESKKWSDQAIWNKISLYPFELKQNFEKLRDFLHQYILSGYSPIIYEQIRLDEKFFRKFYRKLAETEELEGSFVKAMGLTSTFGYEWACFKIQQYYRQYKRPPSSTIYPFNNICYHCKKNSFSGYNIHNWNEFLCNSLQNEINITLDRCSMRNKAGLERARIYLLKNYSSQKKLPRSDDPGMRFISKAINRKAWVDYGIHTWRDLLREVYKGNNEISPDWVGKRGLDLAKDWLKKHYLEDSIKIKQTTAWRMIDQVLYRHYWDEFGIYNWDDLTKNVLGTDKIFKSKVQIQKSLEELNEAKVQLHQFYNENQKIPKSSDFKTIAKNCRNKAWLHLGVSSWHQLIQDMFGIRIYTKDYWTGLTGLNRARDKLQLFYRKHKKMPSPLNKEYLEIFKIVKYQFWKAYHILSWQDLLHYSFPIEYK
jgi:hypothetical protein